jgi:iron(III) transport system ATP-binding protein
VTVRFGTTEAVHEASLRLDEGEVLALLGPSGCGKTTLLRAIAGLQRTESGIIAIRGQVVESQAQALPPHKRPVGMVFQDFALFPHLTVEGNAGYGLGRSPARKERVARLLDLAGIAHLASRHPHQLSAGQQQRVAIVRSLAPEPAVLLLDEPFSNLDPDTKATMRAQVARLLRDAGVSAILVTHDRADAFTVADRIAVMAAGELLQAGEPETLYLRPASREVAALAGTAQYVPAVARRGLLETALGPIRAANEVEDGPCEALVRPEWVTICRGGDRMGLVLERHLEGAMTRLVVRLEGGQVVDVAVPSGLHLDPHEAHAVRVDLPVPAFPVGGGV